MHRWKEKHTHNTQESQSQAGLFDRTPRIQMTGRGDFRRRRYRALTTRQKTDPATLVISVGNRTEPRSKRCVLELSTSWQLFDLGGCRGYPIIHKSFRHLCLATQSSGDWFSSSDSYNVQAQYQHCCMNCSMIEVLGPLHTRCSVECLCSSIQLKSRIIQSVQ